MKVADKRGYKKNSMVEEMALCALMLERQERHLGEEQRLALEAHRSFQFTSEMLSFLEEKTKKNWSERTFYRVLHSAHDNLHNWET